jgi:hypothetical protein
MLTPNPTPADLRAELARRRIKLYKIAPDVGTNPTNIGRMLNESRPMTTKVRDGLVAVLMAMDKEETQVVP